MNELITAAELAALLKVSPRTLARWHTRRIGPARTKIGNFIGYRKSAIEAWLIKNETKPV